MIRDFTGSISCLLSHLPLILGFINIVDNIISIISPIDPIILSNVILISGIPLSYILISFIFSSFFSI